MPLITNMARGLKIKKKKKTQAPQPYGAPTEWGLPPDRFHPTQAQARVKQDLPSKWDRLLGKHKKPKQQNHEPQVPTARVREGHRHVPIPTTRPTRFVGPDGRIVQRPSLNRGNSTARRRQIAEDAALAQQLHAQEQHELRQAARRQATAHQTPTRRPVHTTATTLNRVDTHAARDAATRTRHQATAHQTPTRRPVHTTATTFNRVNTNAARDAATRARHQATTHQTPTRRPVHTTATTLNRVDTHAARDAATRARLRYEQLGVQAQPQIIPRQTAPRAQQPTPPVTPPPHMRTGPTQPNRTNTHAAREATRNARLRYEQQGIRPTNVPDYLAEERAVTRRHTQRNLPYNRTVGAQLGLDRANGRELNNIYDILMGKSPGKDPKDYAITINSEQNVDFHMPTPESYQNVHLRNPDGTLRQRFLNDGVQITLLDDYLMAEHVVTIPRSKLPPNLLVNTSKDMAEARKYHEDNLRDYLRLAPHEPLPHDQSNLPNWIGDPAATPEQARRDFANWLKTFENPVAPRVQDGRIQRTTTLNRGNSTGRRHPITDETLPAQEQRELRQDPTHQTPTGQQVLTPTTALNRADTNAARLAARAARLRYEQQGVRHATVPGYQAGAPRVQQPAARPQINLPDRINHTNQNADIMNSYRVSQLAHDPALLDQYNNLLLMQNHMHMQAGYPQAAAFRGSNPFAGLNNLVAADGTMTDAARAMFEANRNSYHRLAKKHADLANRHYDQWLTDNPQYQQFDEEARQQLAHHEIGRHLDISETAGRIVSQLENSLHGLGWLRNTRFDINSLSGGKKKTKEILSTIRHSLKQTPAANGEIPDPLESVFINERGPQTELIFMDEYSSPLGGDSPINIPTGQIPLTVLRHPKELLGQWLGVGKFPDSMHIEKGAGLHTYD